MYSKFIRGEIHKAVKIENPRRKSQETLLIKSYEIFKQKFNVKNIKFLTEIIKKLGY